MPTASASRVAEKWIQDAVKRPGALSKRLGIPEKEDIPIGRIRAELAKLKKKDKLSADDKLFQQQLNFALTMKTKVDKKAEDRILAAVVKAHAAMYPVPRLIARDPRFYPGAGDEAREILHKIGYLRDSLNRASKTARLNAQSVERMDAEEALKMLRTLSRLVGSKAKDRLDQYRQTAWEAEKQADRLEKAWSNWDWDALAEFGILHEDEAEFALEVLANYTP
jgi:hypothetical protein